MNRFRYRAFAIACMLAFSFSVPTAAHAAGSPPRMLAEGLSVTPAAGVASVEGGKGDEGSSMHRASQMIGGSSSSTALDAAAVCDAPGVDAQSDIQGRDTGSDVWWRQEHDASDPAPQYETDTITFVDSSRVDTLDRTQQKPSFSLRSFFGTGSHAYRAQLDEAQDAVYARLSAAALTTDSFEVAFPQPVQVTVSSAIPLSASDKALIRERMSAVTQSAVDAVLYDCPEIFWLKLGEGGCSSSYAYSVANIGGQYVASVESLTYNVVLEMADAAARKAQVDAKVAAFPVAGSSVYDKVKSIHDELARTITYASGDLSVRSYHNVIGPLLDGLCVCEGYAKAFKLICDREGIPCVLVSGMGITGGGSEPHMWNYVKIGGAWYAVDVTWDDRTTPQAPSQILYDYFLVGANTSQVNFPPKGALFSSTHQSDGDLSGTGFKAFQFPPLSPTAYAHVPTNPLVITRQPEDADVTAPDAVRFSVEAEGGGGTLIYRWEANDGTGWKAIAGATTATLTLPASAPAMDGMKVRCVITDGTETAISEEAALAVRAPIESPTPTPTPEQTPTPSPGGETATPTPVAPTPTPIESTTPSTATPSPDPATPTPAPTKGADDITPTPTKGADDTTPMPTKGADDITPTPTKRVDDTTPTPTKGADETTPTPTQEAATPTPTSTPSTSSTPTPNPSATPTPSIGTQSPAPSVTPSASPSQPTVSSVAESPSPTPYPPAYPPRIFYPYAHSASTLVPPMQPTSSMPPIQSRMQELPSGEIELSVTVVPNAAYEWHRFNSTGDGFEPITGAVSAAHVLPKGDSGMYRVVVSLQGQSTTHIFALNGAPSTAPHADPATADPTAGQIVRPIQDAAKTSNRPMHYAQARESTRLYRKATLKGTTSARLLAGDCVVILGKSGSAYRVLARGQIGYIRKTAVTLSPGDATKNGQIMEAHLTWSVGHCVGMYELANIRVSPDMANERAFDRLPLGADVLVLGETDDFYQVLFGERVGYMRKVALILRNIE